MADLIIFSTPENRDVSSANNFGLDAKSLDKSFIYILGKAIVQVYKLEEPLLQLQSIKGIAHLKQLSALVDMRNPSQYLINYLIYHFLSL